MSGSREGGRLHHDWACEQQGETAGGGDVFSDTEDLHDDRQQNVN